MRKAKETQTFDFRPLGLAIREARERAGLSRNDLGDKEYQTPNAIAYPPQIEEMAGFPQTAQAGIPPDSREKSCCL